MDAMSLQQELTTTFRPAARRAVHAAFDAAYRDAGARFDPKVGCDALWFGVSVWRFGVFRLSEMAAVDPSLGIALVTTGSNQFRLACGPFLMSAYSCGLTAPVDPSKEFPRNDRGAGMLSDINTGQLSLDLPGVPDDTTGLVIAHYGNPDSGLEALYLKAPAAQHNGRISAWGYVEELWRIDGSSADALRGPDLPRPVVIERPLLEFKKPVKKSDITSA